MKAKFPYKTVFFLFISFSFFNCSKTEEIPENVAINDFVWGGMNAYYKWQGDVEDLADTKFSNRNQLNEYLAGFDTPDNLFNSVITSTDELSWITDDYTTIEDAFEGIKLTTGMKVNGKYYNNSGNFYVYVYDVVEGSNAEAQGVTRGMIITEVNGTQLTIANVEGLFLNNSFSISLADYNGGNPVTNGTVINLTKSEIQENPIKNAVFFNAGTQTIGYFMYNSFLSYYDDELNSVFASFRAENLDNLIIDLRYNGGGAIESAAYLGSMITGQFNNEVFSKQIWNDKVMTNVNNLNLAMYFTDEINNGIVTDQVINSLGLTSVYFIVSDATASTAEVLINSLKEYIDVKLIGTQTLGLTEASMTVYDSDTYTKTGDNFNTSHAWAMQPVVLEVQNVNNFNEPNGHIVDVLLEEDSGNLGVLGDPTSDPILSSTIEYITTNTVTPYLITSPVTSHSLWNTRMMFLDDHKMYVTLK